MILVDNEKEQLKIFVDKEPEVTVKNPRFYSKQELKKPYLCKTRAIFTVYYKDKQYVILTPKGYDWDGASIPFGFRWIIGAKGSPEFLYPSLVHDRLCENKEFIDYNRKLSSIIFRELLIAYKVSKFKADIMYEAVDTFQKTQGWNKK